MSKAPSIISVSDLRDDTARVLDRACSSDEPLFIAQQGRATAVLMSIETFERSRNERDVLRLLAWGENEIAAGIGQDLDSVLTEADGLLAEE